MTRSLVVVLLASVCAAAAVTAVVMHRLSPREEVAPEVLFIVEPGASLGSVSRKLEREGIVRDARATEWLARVQGFASQLRAGEYWMSASLPTGEILTRITEGHVATFEVSLPEGFTMLQIGQRLAAHDLVDVDAFAAVVADADFAAELGIPGTSLEGYLYPETYRLPHGLPAQNVARTLVDQFKQAWKEVADDAQRRGLEMREVVILASIVEKETGAPEERPLIASVFANRVAKKMRLESDPTTIYGIPDFDGNLRRVDLENPNNPYNTYRIQGLPPGPIANPGIDALRAVVSPADTDYLYFVSRNDGTHIFSSNYRDHVNAVNRYQRRGGGK